jgi:transposase-like protein
MLSFDRLSGDSGCIELEFLERRGDTRASDEARYSTPSGLIITFGYSLDFLEFGCPPSSKYRASVVQKADLQSAGSANPNHVAVDETVILLNDERYWLYAAVDSDTNRLLHVELFSTRTTGNTSMFLSELRQKHRGDDAPVLVDGAPWLQTACQWHGLRFQHVTHGNRNAVERVFRELKYRTDQFSNMFSHVEPSTAKSWLQAFAFAWNQLI